MNEPPTTAEDDMYTNFLLNANRDHSHPTAPPPGGSKASTHTTNKSLLISTNPDSLPPQVKELHNDRFYTSDVDSPFEAVDLPLPSTPHTKSSIESGVYRHTLARALDIDEEAVKKLSVGEWDPRGEYRDVVEAVEEWVRQGNKVAEGVKGVEPTREGEVAVFAVQGEGARVEYFIVGVVRGGEGKEDRIVGFRVLAVES